MTQEKMRREETGMGRAQTANDDDDDDNCEGSGNYIMGWMCTPRRFSILRRHNTARPLQPVYGTLHEPIRSGLRLGHGKTKNNKIS